MSMRAQRQLVCRIFWAGRVGRSTGMIEEDRSNLRWLVGVALGIGLVFGGTFAAIHWNDKRIDRTAHGELEFAHLMRLADGRPVVLVVEKVLHSGGESMDTHAGRLDVVDAVTG